MREEYSAGGLILTPNKNNWQILLMRDMNGVLTFPKGMIEKDEDPEDAARREIREEVAIENLQLLRHLSTIEYYYKRKGTVHKRVMYFLFLSKTRQKPRVQRKEGITEARWMSFHDAISAVGYPETNRPLIQRARRWIARNTNRLL